MVIAYDKYMLKSVAKITIFSILVSLFAPVASAATLTCKQVNEIKTIKSKEFACTKSAGKLIWKSSKVRLPEIKFIDFSLIPDGFAVSLENIDDTYSITATVATGDTSVDEFGMITVTGNLLPTDLLKVKVAKGKYFRLATYSGDGFDLKTLETPKFAPTLTLNADGFKVLITNYDEDQKFWDATSSRGSAIVTPDGYLWVSDLDKPGGVDIELNISGDGYKSIKRTWSYVMPEVAIEPDLNEFSNITSNSMETKIINFDSSLKWEVTSSAGSVTLSNTGAIFVSGLKSNQSVSVYVTSTTKLGLVASSNITGKTLAVFSNISEREWALIAKDPNGSIGKTIIVYGYITQFDAATGLNQFRAEVNGVNNRTSYGLTGDNTFLTGTKELLQSFVAKDYFYAKVIVTGAYTYTTTFNGSLTVPKLEVVEINRL